MWHAGDWCACAVGKMAKDIGMTIHKSIVVLFLPCLDPFMFFHFLEFFFAVAFLGGRKQWLAVCTAAACRYIDDSHTVQMYNYSSEGPADNCKAIRAKIAGSKNIQHRKRGGY